MPKFNHPLAAPHSEFVHNITQKEIKYKTTNMTDAGKTFW